MKKSKKISVQIYLDPEQNRVIDYLSKKSGKSKASIIRSCINNYVNRFPLEDDPALAIMNLGASGKNNIAEKHDDYQISLNNLKNKNEQ